jgi:geranylgeranyl diphosphate synthase, type I
MVTDATPWDLAGVASAVEGFLRQWLDRETARWGPVGPGLREALDGLASLALGPAKRVRPAFCHLAFVGAGGRPDDPIVTAAGAALELVHAAALIHDDIVDGSETRRGGPSLHARFAERHAVAGWRGAPGRFGEGAALLTGDLALAGATGLLAPAPQPARQVFDQLCAEVQAGQLLDLFATARAEPSAEVALTIARYKTAKYTVERPLHLGAALAIGDADLAPVAGALSAYGLPLGEAFQLRDDLLGAFGDPDVTGKPVGDDFREGKPTLVYALARRAAAPGQARLLDERFGAADLSSEEVAAIQEVLEATGARAEVEAAIEARIAEALGALDGIPFGPATRRGLAEMAQFVVGRDR